MNFVLHLHTFEEKEAAARTDVTEIILHAEAFSIGGGVADTDIPEIVELIKSTGKQVTLLWDLYCTDADLDSLSLRFISISDMVDAVRFSDPGVGLVLKRIVPGLSLQFFAWDGYQNRAGIQRWIELFYPEIQRIIVSNQTTADSIRLLVRETDLPVEIPVLGRLRLFYSARLLLHNHLSDTTDVLAASTDRPEQFFPVMESENGTVIYNDQDLFLLDRLDTLMEMGVKHVSMEPHTAEQYHLIADAGYIPASVETIRKNWNKPLTAGFFDENRTDQLLGKLTNRFLKREKQQQVATVLESIKNSHTLLQLNRPINLPCNVVFLTPERQIVDYRIEFLRDLHQVDYQKGVDAGIYILPWIKFVVPATIMKIQGIPDDDQT